MRKPKGNDQYVKAVEYSHTLEKLLVMERENSAALRSELVAAERERDELREEQAEHDEQIARMEAKFSLAKRALDSKTARCDRAEAELRRRDAAAGEPVAEIKWDGAELTVQNVRGGFSYGVTQVYAAVHPSAVAGTGEPVAYQIHSDLEGWRECTPERYAEVSIRPLVDGKYSGGWLLRKLYTIPPAASAPTAMQPLYIAGDGRIRFKENAIVRHLLTSAGKVGVDLNSIAMDDFSDDDRMQLAQLIGYSLGGYGELSYVSDDSYNAAVAAAPAPGGEK